MTLALAACGSSAASPRSADSPPAPAPPGAACAATVAETLRGVGERIYRLAASGGDVAEAVRRVRGSTSLAAAIAAGDTRTADATLRGLLLAQIVRVEVVRDGRVLASAGAGRAMAPVRGAIPGTGAQFVLSVQSDNGYVQVLRRVSGAQVQLSERSGRLLAGSMGGPAPAEVPASGALSYAGASYEVASLGGVAYPSGAMRIALLVPAEKISCAASSARTRADTLGRVGERIYAEERRSGQVKATVRRMRRAAFFRDAVAERSAPATRVAIERFFAAHLHVVRVRVTVAGRVLVDVGGPYALAPVHGTLRVRGRVVGRFETAIQDDAGYLKLARSFTGAEVLMREGGRQVMGTLTPGPAGVPDRGALSYGGREYQAYSFVGEAFPSGPLRISLLFAG
jgi:hypothetical protein